MAKDARDEGARLKAAIVCLWLNPVVANQILEHLAFNAEKDDLRYIAADTLIEDKPVIAFRAFSRLAYKAKHEWVRNLATKAAAKLSSGTLTRDS